MNRDKNCRHWVCTDTPELANTQKKTVRSISRNHNGRFRKTSNRSILRELDVDINQKQGSNEQTNMAV